MIVQAGIKAPGFCILKGAETKKDHIFWSSESKCNTRKKWELPKIKIKELFKSAIL